MSPVNGQVPKVSGCIPLEPLPICSSITGMLEWDLRRRPSLLAETVPARNYFVWSTGLTAAVTVVIGVGILILNLSIASVDRVARLA